MFSSVLLEPCIVLRRQASAIRSDGRRARGRQEPTGADAGHGQVDGERAADTARRYWRRGACSRHASGASARAGDGHSEADGHTGGQAS